tara:strand:- start:690 stop:1154 length:465 start_codon:yes stop_codon:yes gene_type:complete
MLKNFILLILFTFTVGCGYEAVYSKKYIIKNSNFSVGKVVSSGDRTLNIKIERRLKNYSGIKRDKIYALDITSESLRTVIAKNIKGDPEIYKLDININVMAVDQNKKETMMRFSKSFKYNNSDDKIELKTNEEEIKNNLAESITRDLVSRLANN